MEGSHAPESIIYLGLEFNPKIIWMSLIVSIVLIFIAWLASRKLNKIPQGWQNILEYAIEFIEKLIKENMGERFIKYTYFFGSLFLFILVSNMLGLIPGLTSPTSDISVNFTLAVFWVVWMQFIGIKENGLKSHLAHYFKPFVFYFPIHLLELGIRTLTLTMRLFANIFAGEVLLQVLTQYFPILVPAFWIAMSIAIGGIQAFIFTILTISYTSLSVSHAD